MDVQGRDVPGQGGPQGGRRRGRARAGRPARGGPRGRRAAAGQRVSRRGQIVLSDEELAAFLDEERVVTCATLGRDGWPHLMPLWYVVRGATLWAWTYGKSQKVRNLERDDRCTLQVEAGERYEELRGAMLQARALIHRDLDTVAGVGIDLARRYGGAEPAGEALAALQAQARKRVALEFREVSRATWDHRKLAGGPTGV